MEDIRVLIVKFGDRPSLQMRYRDPLTGRKKTRSAETSDRKEAQKAAGKWEAELREGRYHAPAKITWAEFRTKYEDLVLKSLADSTDQKVCGVFNAVEKHLNPLRLRDVTAERIAHLQAKLREAGRSEDTIKGHLAHLGAALNWGVRMGLLPKAPTIDAPRRAKGSKVMKGRPIAGEEFERMLAAVHKIIEEHEDGTAPPSTDSPDVASWKHYLRGLWLSGLRLGESLELHWERRDRLHVDLAGKRPMLRIPAELEKGHKDRLLPIAPEFAELLMGTPEGERRGYVFNPAARRVRGERLSENRVGDIISAVGKKAGVKVDSRTKDGKEVVKFASAHDLRRSFGARWASRIMPQVLMELMRHESIETTLKYYVGRNAESTADVLWAAHEKAAGNTLGNSCPKTPDSTESETASKSFQG